MLALAVTSAELPPGQVDTITITLTNTNSRPVSLNFLSGCQILPYIRDARGVTVLPSGGGWVCTAALSRLELAAGERHARTFVWSGSTEFASELLVRRLPPGVYFVSAVVSAAELHLATQPVAVRLE
jgi:hypothetical protein